MNLDPSTLLSNASEFEKAIKKELAKRSLLEFTRQAWPILEPGAPMKQGWVLEAICEHLEAVAKGDIKRLVINIPPGASKSRLTRVMFPLWLWTNKPWMRIIGASYALNLSERDNYYARTILQNDWYQDTFGVSISSEQGAKVNFDNGSMGGLRAISVGGATTGFRGDLLVCFPAGEMVATERGDMPIEQVVESADPNLRVWSLDPRKGEMVLEKPSRWMKNPGDDIYEVGFSDGTKMRCTGDHKVLALGGWKPAALLTSGDVLLRLVEGRSVQNVSGPLLPRFPASDGVNLHLGDSELLSDVPSSPVAHLGNLSGRRSVNLGLSPSPEGAVPFGVLDVFRTGSIGNIADMVVSRIAVKMSNIMSFWSGSDKRQRNGNMGPDHNALTINAGVASRVSVPIVAQLHKFLGHLVGESRALPTNTPYDFGLGPDKTCAGDGVSLLGSGYKTPLYVRHVGHADSTFCLTVERTGNFVCANTIVSNCDDAHNASEGESDAKRHEAVQWFLETFQTRVNDLDHSPIVVIGQRIHEEDVYNAAIELGYDHLNIPMEWDESMRKTTSIGWTDPRTKEDELMWPERFSAQAVERLKKAMGPYAAAAQLQQTPVPRKGGLIQVDGIKVIDELPDEPFIAVRAWDLAASEGAGAYSVGVLMYYGQQSEQFYVADVKRAQLGGGAVRKLINDTAQEDGILTKIILPQDPGAAGKVVVEDLIAGLAGYNARAEAQSGAKTTRAEPFAAQVEIGRVSVLKRVWTKAFLDELRFFPKGKYVDQVDAVSSAFNAVAPMSRTKQKRKPSLTLISERQESWVQAG
jgi:predicted phage terminase large subunit-like protein